MKEVLILFLAVYFLAEVSGRPETQVTPEAAQELLDGVKTVMQNAWNQAQNKTSEVFNRARDFFQNTFSSSQQSLGQEDGFLNLTGEKVMQGLEKIKQI